MRSEQAQGQMERRQMSESKQIRQKIMEMVITADYQRQRPHLVLRTVSNDLGVPIFRVNEVLENLIKERKLVFTYRDPCSFVEIPINDMSRGSHLMKVVVDCEGNPWICNHDVDPSKDLAEQGCWQAREEDSTQNS